MGFSGGIWILWDTTVMEIQILISHRQFVHTKVRVLGDSQEVFVTFVYGSPQATFRFILWDNLPLLRPSSDDPWIVLGDFNAYLEAGDKAGGNELNFACIQRFHSCLVAC